MKLTGIVFKAIAIGFALTQMSLGLKTPEISRLDYPSLPPRITQNTVPQTAPASSEDRELLQQLYACLSNQLRNPEQATIGDMQAASMECTYRVILLAPDGSIRPDASDRMRSIVRVLGIRLPQPTAQGQATVQLQPVGDTQIFAVPVTIGERQELFLLDLGASNSIIAEDIVQELGLTGTPIPPEFFAYGVVGDDCDDIQATVQTLPQLTIESAQVGNLMSMGMPKMAIPQELPGVVGMDVVSQFDLILNPQTRQLQLLTASPSPGAAIPLQGKMGIMTAQVRINGQGPFTFLLDTGAEYMVVSESVAQQLNLDTENASEIDVRGFCGTEKAKQVTLSQVQLSDHTQDNLPSVVLQSRVLGFLGVDGIIGQNFLNQYQQHWRFGDRNELGFAEQGSLVLTPLSP